MQKDNRTTMFHSYLPAASRLITAQLRTFDSWSRYNRALLLVLFSNGIWQ